MLTEVSLVHSCRQAGASIQRQRALNRRLARKAAGLPAHLPARTDAATLVELAYQNGVHVQLSVARSATTYHTVDRDRRSVYEFGALPDAFRSFSSQDPKGFFQLEAVPAPLPNTFFRAAFVPSVPLLQAVKLFGRLPFPVSVDVAFGKDLFGQHLLLFSAMSPSRTILPLMMAWIRYENADNVAWAFTIFLRLMPHIQLFLADHGSAIHSIQVRAVLHAHPTEEQLARARLLGVQVAVQRTILLDYFHVKESLARAVGHADGTDSLFAMRNARTPAAVSAALEQASGDFHVLSYIDDRKELLAPRYALEKGRLQFFFFFFFFFSHFFRLR